MSNTPSTASILDAVGQKQQTQSERYEKVRTLIYPSSVTASAALAKEVADLICQRSERGQDTVLGLATGSTPVGFYRELIRLHREEGLSFRRVTTFNLDEYYGLTRDHPESYRRFMQDQLFDHVDLDPARTHLPDGSIRPDEVYAHCLEYEQRIADAGGLDLQILGIGRSGHIGFNEPGSAIDSRTRMITLDRVTRQDAAADFMGIANVPRSAITMGVGSILDAKCLVLMAWGANKAEIVQEAVEGPVNDIVSASALQAHSNATFLLDSAAASGLTRFRYPWLTGQVEWDTPMKKRASIWLSQTLQKPIAKLEADDYAENGAAGMIVGNDADGSADDADGVNGEVLALLEQTMAPALGEDADTQAKKILVFSPEPLDAFLGMGGTIARLQQQGHEVHLAIQTSGNLRVMDAAALSFAQATQELSQRLDAALAGSSLSNFAAGVLADLDEKGEFGSDSERIRDLKGVILRGDTQKAATCLGLAPNQIHFLELSFYEKGRYRRFRFEETDAAAIEKLIESIQPDLVFTTGDASDPSTPQGIAFRSLVSACGIGAEGGSKSSICELYLYRANDKAYAAHEIEKAVPITPRILGIKLAALRQFRSLGADDLASARAERDRHAASVYNNLGLFEHEALEVFRRWCAGA